MTIRTLGVGAAMLMLAACNRNDTASGSPDIGGDRQASITLTGCLQAGEQGLASPEPGAAPSASGNAERFVLANAKLPASAGSSDSSGPLYILEGKQDELREHLSQQVEVTGRLDDDSSAPGQCSAPRGGLGADDRAFLLALAVALGEVDRFHIAAARAPSWARGLPSTFSDPPLLCQRTPSRPLRGFL